jgi:tRNA-splicing ligase RtcB
VDIFKKETYRVPVFSWCPDLELGARTQVDNLAQLPFAFDHVAVMSDAHQGFGMPIGGVIALDNVVIPNAVGVDIGCGMLACKTGITEITRDQVKAVMGNIRQRVPVGFNWHKSSVAPLNKPPDKLPVIKHELPKATVQLGTLGGGNHFLELQVDSDGYVWYMIHSGSRNLGKQIADHYNKIAKDQNQKAGYPIPPSWDLAFFEQGDPNFDLYLLEMQYAVDFALQNRQVMADQVEAAILEVIAPVKFQEPINIAHNYASLEKIGGKELYIHRKGATSAREKQAGIIPGSQGTSSYIVEGLGNPDSFYSCSHGAGRKMGRNQAKKNLNLADEIKRLDDLGVVHGIRHEKDLDEAAGAYKDIESVMENQKDLVKIVTKLTPIGVVKG